MFTSFIYILFIFWVIKLSSQIQILGVGGHKVRSTLSYTSHKSVTEKLDYCFQLHNFLFFYNKQCLTLLDSTLYLFVHGDKPVELDMNRKKQLFSVAGIGGSAHENIPW